MRVEHQKIAVFTKSPELFSAVKKIIPEALGEVTQYSTFNGELGFTAGVTLVLVDGKWDGDVRALLDKLSAAGAYVVLVDEEKHIGEDVPDLLLQGLVDDLLLTPIRAVELLGKIRHVAHLSRVSELVSVNADLKILIEKFEEDLRATRAIQRSLIPEKFPGVHGLKVAHKYLSGLKSGGDYLDFFEFEDKTHVGILMSDSTGYGLSSAFMSVILRLAIKLSKDEAKSPSTTIVKIFEELQLTMKAKENLSIFYAVLNRKTFELTYASAGTVRFFHASNGKTFDRSGNELPLIKGQALALKDEKVTLLPEDRLAICTDGFYETFTDKKLLEKHFEKTLKADPIEFINEFTYRVKKKFEAEDDMPEQDCAVMVVDIEKRAMRLAQ